MPNCPRKFRDGLGGTRLRIVGEVPRVNGKTLPYKDFWMSYMAANQPVVLTGLMDTWQSTKDWRMANGEPNLSFIKDKFGDSHVQVAECSQRDSTDQLRVSMSVSQFIEYWEKEREERERVREQEGMEVDGEEDELYYLKDWHFVKEYPQYTAYTTPLFFSQDWLNDYFDPPSPEERGEGPEGEEESPEKERGGKSPEEGVRESPKMREGESLEEGGRPDKGREGEIPEMEREEENDGKGRGENLAKEREGENREGGKGESLKFQSVECSDYRFVYMGPKGSWTPLHSDVLRSFSWSSNVCGRKRWLLASPEQTEKLRHRYSRRIVYDIESDVPLSQFPQFQEIQWLECTQEEGEIIFVPSGWYHQVTNLWKLLREDYLEAELEISDIREIADDFESLCQRNLQINSGMNFSDFLTFLAIMVDRDLRSLQILIHNRNHFFLNSDEIKFDPSMCQNLQSQSECHHCFSQLSLDSNPHLSVKNLFEKSSTCIACCFLEEICQLFFNLNRMKNVTLCMGDVLFCLEERERLPFNKNTLSLLGKVFPLQNFNRPSLFQTLGLNIKIGCSLNASYLVNIIEKGLKWAKNTLKEKYLRELSKIVTFVENTLTVSNSPR